MSCILWFDLSLKLPWQLVNSLPNLVGDDWLTVSGHRAIHILEWWLEVTDTIYNPTTDPMTACELPLHWSLTIDQPPWPTPWPYDCMTWPHDQLQRQSPRKNPYDRPQYHQTIIITKNRYFGNATSNQSILFQRNPIRINSFLYHMDLKTNLVSKVIRETSSSQADLRFEDNWVFGRFSFIF